MKVSPTGLPITLSVDYLEENRRIQNLYFNGAKEIYFAIPYFSPLSQNQTE